MKDSILQNSEEVHLAIIAIHLICQLTEISFIVGQTIL